MGVVSKEIVSKLVQMKIRREYPPTFCNSVFVPIVVKA